MFGQQNRTCALCQTDKLNFLAKGVCTVRYGILEHSRSFRGPPPLPSPPRFRVSLKSPLGKRAPVLGADFRARFTATVLGNQACSAQTKSEEIARAIRASSCRATVSSKQGCGGLQWSVTRKQCERSLFTVRPSKEEKKTPLLSRCPEPNRWREWADQRRPPATWITGLRRHTEGSSSAQRHRGWKYRLASCPFFRVKVWHSCFLWSAARSDTGFVNTPWMTWRENSCFHMNNPIGLLTHWHKQKPFN